MKESIENKKLDLLKDKPVEGSTKKFFLISAAKGAINSIKNSEILNGKSAKNILLGASASLLSIAGNAQNETAKGIDIDPNDHQKIEQLEKKGYKIKRDTTYYYSEAMSNPEYKNTAGSLKEIMQKYRDATVNAYEVHTTNTKFRKLREGKYKNNTQETSIKYKGKEVNLNIFKKGEVEAMIQYYKDLGLKPNSIITQLVNENEKPLQTLRLSDLNETAYEQVVNLHRTWFVNGALWGQDAEHSRWGFLNGEKGENGIPVIILNVVINGKNTSWLVGLGECNGNHLIKFADSDCVRDVKSHNESVLDK